MLEAAFPASKNEPVEFFLVDRFIDWVQGESDHGTSRRASCRTVSLSAEHMQRLVSNGLKEDMPRNA